ncbi:hypothetical protein NDU88_000599 [Pleurodeles waltl]|uniref:Receptor ligand binding region domain-containing protein n=1 Tax=Pleurodeles waltl TaxID=8319 RepID=A0AAV7KW16_PLEWA|nr:hypothetical protein NDU88_000599 [Pleurodeles waltl]
MLRQPVHSLLSTHTGQSRVRWALKQPPAPHSRISQRYNRKRELRNTGVRLHLTRSIPRFVSGNYQWLQSMVFAIEEINKNVNLLPNITLGFRIHDSCMTYQRALRGVLWMLTGEKEPIPNYQCLRNLPFVAIIGDAISTRSIILAQILGLYRSPPDQLFIINPTPE